MSAPVTVLGAGCAGPLLAVLLARRGHAVRIYERRADPRRGVAAAGRSINLALAARGMAALEQAGLMDAVRPLLLPMRGRALHEADGALRFLPYGQHADEVVWAVSRAALNRALLDAAERAGVALHFGHACTGVDLARGTAHIADLAAGTSRSVPMAPLLGADGGGSVLRAALVAAGQATAREEPLAHRYKELTIPAGGGGRHRLDPGALHLWPRGGYMLIALPNTDGTFTATLFMAAGGGGASFAALEAPGAARALFARDFADALALMPDFDAEYAAHPVGRLATVYASPWHHGGRLLLLGDAAHAIVPFHGQGMNAAFEDCRMLDDLLAGGGDWAACFERFDALRRPDADAIARMALENYVEMRDTVREPRFALQKELALALERRYPRRFVPRYSMVMFHAEIPYAEAERRGAVQARLLDAATAGCASLADVDLAALDAALLSVLPVLPGAPA